MGLEHWEKDALTKSRVILTDLLLPQGAGAEEQEGDKVSYSLAPHFSGHNHLTILKIGHFHTIKEALSKKS